MAGHKRKAEELDYKITNKRKEPEPDDDSNTEEPEPEPQTTTELTEVVILPPQNKLNLFPIMLMMGLSLLAWPICYLNNELEKNNALIDKSIRFWSMAVIYVLAVVLIVFCSRLAKTKDHVLYTGMAIFTLGTMVDVICALGVLEVMPNLVDEYILENEPHLYSPWGIGVTLFGATGFMVLHALFVFPMTNGKSWRSIGIYWGCGILNSMIVLLIGVMVGRVNSPTASTFLNIPFVFFPVYVLVRAFNEKPQVEWDPALERSRLTKLTDIFLALGFLLSIWVTLAKGLASLGCRGWPIWNTVKSEPSLFLQDPAPFAILQALLLMFYILPLQSASFLYLFKTEKPRFLWDIAVVQAGVMIQTQFTVLFQCFSWKTPDNYFSDWMDPQVWLFNLVLGIVPHLLLIRLWPHRKASLPQNNYPSVADKNK